MNYEAFSAQLLCNKRRMEAAVQNLQDEIFMLEEAKVSVKTSAVSYAPITGSGGNRYEDRLVKLICLCDELKLRQKNLLTNLACIERGLEPLSDYERALLYGFYIEGGKSAAERMMSRFHKERSTIYRDKEKALAHFTQALYGSELPSIA